MPATPGHDGLAAEAALGTDLARHARHFRGKRAQLIHHRVDGVLQEQDLAAHIDGDLLGEIAAGDGDRDLRDVPNLGRQVAGHRVDAVGQVLPHATDAPHLRLPAQFAVGAHLARHARHFGREHAQLLNHRVDDGGRAPELALERTAVDIHPDRLQQVTFRHRRQDTRHLRGWPEEIVDEHVDRDLHPAPGPARSREPDPLPGLSLFSDDHPHALELARHPGVRGHDLVERVGNLAFEPDPVAGQPDREIALPDGLQGAQELAKL